MEERINRFFAASKNLRIKENKLFLGNYSGKELLTMYGSPLYVYLEDVIRERCREVKNMVDYNPMVVHYSIKANSNVALLKIVKEEGLHVDAISPGEILCQLEAGFSPDDIFYIGNNVDSSEFRFAIEKGVRISVDSLAQLERYGRLNPGGKVAVRINPGLGDGHHEKVIAAGEKAKFGVFFTDVEEIKNIAGRYGLRVNGLNMHIGSNFLNPKNYILAAHRLLSLAKNFHDLDFIDIGGGFGIPYDRVQERLDLKKLGQELSAMFHSWSEEYGKQVTFVLEPGRYIVAESGILLSTVNSIKTIAGRTFVGTDAGFNVLARPTMYGSYHEVINIDNLPDEETMIVDICGNICEPGDLIARDRRISKTSEEDVFAIMDAGAYGFSMSSNYNCRLRPAEVLIKTDGSTKLVRHRETLQDLLRHQVY